MYQRDIGIDWELDSKCVSWEWASESDIFWRASRVNDDWRIDIVFKTHIWGRNWNANADEIQFQLEIRKFVKVIFNWNSGEMRLLVANSDWNEMEIVSEMQILLCELIDEMRCEMKIGNASFVSELMKC